MHKYSLHYHLYFYKHIIHFKSFGKHIGLDLESGGDCTSLLTNFVLGEITAPEKIEAVFMTAKAWLIKNHDQVSMHLPMPVWQCAFYFSQFH